MQSYLDVNVTDVADCRLVSVTGRIDHTNADLFLKLLTKHTENVAPTGGMVIEMQGLEFITSAGLRTLLLAQKSIKQMGAKLVVCGLGGVVGDVFRISKFDTLLSIAGSTQEAVGRISADAKRAYTG